MKSESFFFKDNYLFTGEALFTNLHLTDSLD